MNRIKSIRVLEWHTTSVYVESSTYPHCMFSGANLVNSLSHTVDVLFYVFVSYGFSRAYSR